MKQDSVSFTVKGLPPKKDAANSMWRKPTEIPRIKKLRVAAVGAMKGHPPFESNLHLEIQIYANTGDGDLDNFITGICDGLMAANKGVRVDETIWADLPESAHPRQSIMFLDDKHICKIKAERLPCIAGSRSYSIRLVPVS